MEPSQAGIILITGAAGNLGSLLARHLAANGYQLRLMVHRSPVPPDLSQHPNVAMVSADLGHPSTIEAAVAGVAVVVHFAGVLFSPRPETFLPETNTKWFANLLSASLAAGVKKVVLISFPHVEGPTTPDHPATGRTDMRPISVHAQTRLAEERLPIGRTAGGGTTAVILRLGMVYGPGILMIEAAKWLARHRLLAVWREPTFIHLISTQDYLNATESAVAKEEARGIYHVGDEQPVTLQDFLDEACHAWRCRVPWRVPVRLIYLAAALCELFASIARTRSPLTRDFITIGRVSYCGDTSRTRNELIDRLRFPTLAEGIVTLRAEQPTA